MPPVFKTTGKLTPKTTGNQTGYDLDKDPNTLYNPGFADSGRAEQRSETAEVYTNHDISVPAKTTLGSYLSAVTAGKAGNSRPNSFYVDDTFNDTEGSGQTVNKSASSKTFPSYARSQIESAGATIGSYMDLAKSYDPNLASRFESTKDSQYSSNQNPFVGTDIKQPDSATRRKGLDGNSLLTNVKPTPGTVTGGTPGKPSIGDVPEDAPLVQKKISDVLRSNRFSPITRAFVQDNERQVRGGYSIQRQMGVYDESKAAVNEDRLKEIGQLLMVRATGHDTDINVADRNRISTLSNTVPFYPSAAQLTGLPIIDVINLQAGDVPITDTQGNAQSPRSEYITQENPELSPFSGKSYGVLNSHLEPFDGAFPIGTLTTAIGNILAVGAFTVTIGYLVQLLGASGAGDEAPGQAPWELEMGRYGVRSTSEYTLFFRDLLGIPNTSNRFGDCVLAGFLSFLGMVNDGVGDRSRSDGFAGIDGDSILRGAVNLFFAPGYYASVLRNAVRDVQQVVQSVADIGSAGSSGQVLAAIAGVFKMIESITSSSIYRFLMSMVALGDTILNSTKKMDVDTLPYGSASRYRKSRIGLNESGNEDHSLAWKHSSTPSMYILPTSFSNARIQSKNSTTIELPRLDGLGLQETSRIPSGIVEAIEDELESEYVPFYFHDLRTNEIISFHAFLSSLSDGFTANYTNTPGYGRTDEVMTYSSTKRSISLEFSVVATSKKDMDVMYWNVNKLVSMLYPQFSRGRTMQSGDDRFIQPFSQIPTASPMIRLRVGDVVKSNYSKFGLARLFGLGQDKQAFGRINRTSSSTQPDRPTVEENNTAGQKARETELAARNQVGFANDQEVILVTDLYSVCRADGTLPSGQQLRNLRNRQRIAIFSGKVKKVLSRPARAQRRRTRAQTSIPGTNVDYVIQISDDVATSAVPNIPVELRYVRVSHSQVNGFTDKQSEKIKNEALARIVAQRAPAPQQTESAEYSDQQLSDFFDSFNNPIVRSFESTRGRGLAGFITDLKTDWQESTWEIDPGMRAPKFMKISISFSPIHDLPLGLDSDGMMKSVAYNVGSISRTVGSDPYNDIGEGARSSRILRDKVEREMAAASLPIEIPGNETPDNPLPRPGG